MSFADRGPSAGFWCTFFAVVVFLVPALAGVLSAPAGAATTGQLQGTVTDAQTHQPIEGAKVTAVAPTGTYHSTSNAKGVFTIAGVTPDTYVITVTAEGYVTVNIPGITVTPDETSQVPVTLAHTVKSLATVRVRSTSSAFQPSQTVDRYNINAQGINQLLGKSFNADQRQLLRALPAVTIDKSGTALIRGGTSFQTAFQVEGIDYTLPTKSVGNRFENLGNGNVLNGISSVEIIPGGGDATHGDTGTGLITMLAKRGSYPNYGTLDLEASAMGLGEQIGLEYGVAGINGRVSNYLSFIGQTRHYQWGPYGTDPSRVGALAFTSDPTQNSNINAHTGALWTTAYYNPARQQVRDFVDNFIWKVGKAETKSIQAFVQTQHVVQDLDYGGWPALTVIDPASQIFCCAHILPTFKYIFNYTFQQDQLNTIRPYLPTVPGGAPGDNLSGPEYNNTPFTAYKLEYQDIINDSTASGLRFYQTFSDQQQYLASQGIYIPSNGGVRTGGSADLTKTFSTKNYLQIGGKYEFVHPYASIQDNTDYLLAFDSLYNFPTFNQIPVASKGDIIPDFIIPSPVVFDASGNIVGGTPGCAGTYLAGSGNPYPSPPHPFQCGYLAKYFGSAIPPLPTTEQVPTANEQVYGWYAQDTITPNQRIKALVGLRWDGYNFQIPNDVQNSPAVTGIKQQTVFEPHLGLAYKMDANDVIRANYGYTLAIPLPTFLGADINRALFTAYQNIPSYDNLTGKPAMYCGPGKPFYNVITATEQFGGTQQCANYADQLYWLERNYRFGLQGQINYPLQGATFSNYDLSYGHEFPSGAAFKVTPFYRRGYNIVETTRTLQGVDVVTGAALYSPEVYSNLGFQEATGVEMDVTSPPKLTGLSGQFTATYINQFGNDPPGNFLPTASLLLGNVYHSPEIAPFQSTLALTYKNQKFPLTYNPIFSFISGYPYGTGVYQAITYHGTPIYVPITDALYNSSQSALLVPAWVNPQNPGSIFSPNVPGTQGTDGYYSGPGTLRSSPEALMDLTIQYVPPNFKRTTYGMFIRNLFSNAADIPVQNLARNCQPVSAGVCGSLPGSSSSFLPPTIGRPLGVGNPYGAYIIYPNQAPINVTLYAQVGL
ncbi:MAG: TonB-dependent receptor [Candidatus Eremiobacteraeota bacterium]|nr:TonB-dependent receptor [Candidatus Eremiobacteraeota bacterium]MBV8264041.1 TonB-dependent receptor [Candidatus Eremiobacteraeota bacterium]MBV8340611.1 TonB-dependent receptor [Candidatus Eremiobacteraeota bacterium]MBV8459791.1 TonB-dependent receptor [Candidatus Eremiobacteraeota bacterium]